MDLQAHAAAVRRLVHEFNNLLLVIGGHCELLSEQCASSAQAKADLAAVAEAVSRATVLTGELRADRRCGRAERNRGPRCPPTRCRH